MRTVGPATLADLGGLSDLLFDAGLPDRVGSRPGDVVIVVKEEGVVVAGAAVEHHGPDGLLRSVVVTDSWRGTGLGVRVVGEVLQAAANAGVGDLYLLTETAPGFFERFGFDRVDRDSVPDDVAGSEEFAVLCCDTAVAMRLGRLADG